MSEKFQTTTLKEMFDKVNHICQVYICILHMTITWDMCLQIYKLFAHCLKQRVNYKMIYNEVGVHIFFLEISVLSPIFLQKSCF